MQTIDALRAAPGRADATSAVGPRAGLPDRRRPRSLARMIENRTEVRVRYAETDMMGIVYHANYLPWFEIGRTELLRAHVLPYRKFEDEGFRLPVLEVTAKYVRPALYDDVVTIVTRLREKPTVRIRLEYELHARGQLLATGHTLHAFLNRENQPTRPPAAFTARMNDLFPAA